MKFEHKLPVLFSLLVMVTIPCCSSTNLFQFLSSKPLETNRRLCGNVYFWMMHFRINKTRFSEQKNSKMQKKERQLKRRFYKPNKLILFFSVIRFSKNDNFALFYEKKSRHLNQEKHLTFSYNENSHKTQCVSFLQRQQNNRSHGIGWITHSCVVDTSGDILKITRHFCVINIILNCRLAL